MSNKYLSTTALSKELNITTKNLFSFFESAGLIIVEQKSWYLTEQGKEKGGILKTHPQHGTYIAWNETIKSDPLMQKLNEETNLLTATILAKQFSISKLRINPILSEIGLIQKSLKGWTVTKLGESLGGKQFEHDRTGIPFVSWNESILTNKLILETMKELQGDITPDNGSKIEQNQTKVGFRDKFEAKHRTADGHYVRSRAESLIDNWLYMSEIVHAYERKLPIEEEVYCDFYLPNGKVYIEFWGLENDERYVQRKNEKIRIYEKYNFNLIQIDDNEIQNLDDILPKKLLKFGIQAY